jgi:hypothetical protein
MLTVFAWTDELEIFTWVDAFYAVCDDMKSRTSGCTSLSSRNSLPKSNKQSFNTRSPCTYNLGKSCSSQLKVAINLQVFCSAIKLEKN